MTTARGTHPGDEADPEDPTGRESVAPARIVLADDHAIFLAGLRDALAARPGLAVVATAANGLEAIAAVKRHRPDLAVFDDSMPGTTGLEAFGEARRWSRDTRFAILTGMVAPARLAEMRALGVDGIFLKSMAPEAIGDGIEAVLRGEQVLGEGIDQHLARTSAANALTPRERQVLEGIARGMSNATMGETLGLSAKTIDTHRTNLMRKMDARNVAALLLSAIRHGLIDGV